MLIPHAYMIYRIAAGAALGGLIGWERDLHGRHVGLRTHLIVAMTAATFMVVSTQFVYFQDYAPGEFVNVDASRIAASVVSAIGFLAGGAILKTGATIQGITTSAGLWLVTAIGLAAGGGMYVEASFVTAMGLVALTLLRVFEDKEGQPLRRKIILVLSNNRDGLPIIMKAMEDMGIEISNFDYERSISDQKTKLTFEAMIPIDTGVNKLIEMLEQREGVEQVHVRNKE